MISFSFELLDTPLSHVIVFHEEPTEEREVEKIIGVVKEGQILK